MKGTYTYLLQSLVEFSVVLISNSVQFVVGNG